MVTFEYTLTAKRPLFEHFSSEFQPFLRSTFHPIPLQVDVLLLIPHFQFILATAIQLTDIEIDDRKVLPPEFVI